MTVTYKDYTGKNYILSEVMPQLPGADENTVSQTINSIAREFYKETLAWHKTVDCSGVTLPAGPVDLDLSSYVHAITESRFADIYRIPVMWIDTEKVLPTSTPNLSQNTSNYTSKITSGNKFYHQSSGLVRFTYPLQAAYVPTSVIVVFVLVPNINVANAPNRLTPTPTDKELPVDAYKEHSEALVAGVLSRMMAQPSKPYTNLALARFHGVKYRNDTIKYRNEAKRFLTLNTNDITPFPFFG